MNSSSVIELKGIVKKFEDITALHNINLEIEAGKVYGLIGRNGAGKTTLLKLLSSQIFQTDGEIEFSQEVIKKRSDISFGRAYNIKYFSLKIKEIIRIASLLYENWRQDYADELIEKFELNTKKRYSSSSAGMQTMTSLIIALAANPSVLLLDEPYVGLDPINRDFFYGFLREKYFDGEKTVIISSHMIDEIEGYFEKAIFLDKGKILVNDDLENIKKQSYVITVDETGYDFIEKNYNILDKEGLGNRRTYYIFDKMRESDFKEIEKYAVELQNMSLQTLMVKMLRKGAK